jgi:glycyl-tRNA synthetase
MNPKVWEASGHVDNFTDPLVECKECHHRFRADQIDLSKGCPDCKGELTPPMMFNILMKTFLGAVEDTKSVAYLRGETAQAMFIDFPAIQQMSRKKLPFGIAQNGRAFRNEITPGNFIFRTREFDLMEFEYFFDPKKSDWKEIFEFWKKEMERWMDEVGIDAKKTHAVDIPDGERAHYSQRTIDFEFEYPFGQKELFGLAYRGDYDLAQHEKMSGKELRALDAETNEWVRPHVIEPAFGADRAMLAVLISAFEEQKLEGDAVRTVLHLKPTIAPVQVAVFPLMKNKPELVEKARGIYNELKKSFRCEFDDNGNVGKRYRRQDEIGTPYCVTIDFESLEDGAVTVRNRDTMAQERVAITDLQKYFSEHLK